MGTREGAVNRATFLKRAGIGAALVAGAGGTAAAAGPPRLTARKPSLAALARVTQGRLITPGSAGYNAAQQVVNARFSGKRPLAVLQARNAQDVRQAVLWCARNGVQITARSGGHSYAGYSTLNGGLVVDLSALDGIRVSSDRRTVQIGAGNRLIDVYTALANRGLTIPAGSCPTVGVGGLALGGGVGLASRALGTTSDNVVGLTVVTADGQVRVCDARTNPDLYWACRGGGGGNFGIATGFTFTTHRVDSASYFFANFSWSDAADVIAAWQRWAPNAPPELFSICSLGTSTGNTPVLNVFGQYMGSATALRRTLARGLTSAVSPASIQVGTAPYLSLMQRWAGCLGESAAACRTPPHQLFAAKSRYALKPISGAGIRAMIATIEQRQRQSSLGSGAIEMDSYGGVINEVAPGATAFVHRNALFSLQYAAYWETPGAASAGLTWIRGAVRSTQPYVSGYSYQNYIDPELATWQKAYYGTNLSRLIDVKSTVDPDDLFRFRQSIPVR